MLRAVENWTRVSPPENPEGWLYTVAYNACLESRRREARQRSIIERDFHTELDTNTHTELADADVAMVRMLLVCCHESLSIKASMVLALKVLCGLGVCEIARRLFESEDNVYKISQRARGSLGRRSKSIFDLDEAQVSRRLPSLYRVLYALFCEGYNSLAGEVAVRAELCAEAIRLATIVAATPCGRDPQLYALLALMHFGAARLPGRVGVSGELLLLEEQDRSKWDRAQIATGVAWLERSATGATFSRYHAEAGIAAEHCMAPSFQATDWEKIVKGYELLFHFDRPAVNLLDWVVALAECRGPAAAMTAFQQVDLPKEVRGSYLWFSVASTLERRLGNIAAANELGRHAIAEAPTPAAKELIERIQKR